MKHPTPEEWMAFLYNEDGRARHAELEAHSQDCAQCAERLRGWRGGKQFLDESPAQSDEAIPTRQVSFLRAATAAVLMLGVGLAIGRGLQGPSAELAEFKAQVTKEFDQRLAAAVVSFGAEAQRGIAGLAQAQDERRTMDREVIISMLRQMDTRHSEYLAVLRTELETVALNTENGLIETHQRLGILASSAQPVIAQPQ